MPSATAMPEDIAQARLAALEWMQSPSRVTLEPIRAAQLRGARCTEVEAAMPAGLSEDAAEAFRETVWVMASTRHTIPTLTPAKRLRMGVLLLVEGDPIGMVLADEMLSFVDGILAP